MPGTGSIAALDAGQKAADRAGRLNIGVLTASTGEASVTP